MAIKERAAHKVVAEAREQLEQVASLPAKHGRRAQKTRSGPPSKAPVSLEQAEQALEAASREHERLTLQREQVYPEHSRYRPCLSFCRS